MKVFIRVSLILLFCFPGWFNPQISAQDEDWVKYTALDGGFTFYHPASWQIVEEDYHVAVLLGKVNNAAGQSQQIIVQVLDPEVVEAVIGSTVEEAISWALHNMNDTVSEETATSVKHGSLIAQRIEIDRDYVYSFERPDYRACLVIVKVSSGEIDNATEAYVFDLFASLAKPLEVSFNLSGARPLHTTHLFEQANIELDLPLGWTTNEEVYAPAVTITDQNPFEMYTRNGIVAMVTLTRASWLFENLADNAPLRVVLTREIDADRDLVGDLVQRHYSLSEGIELAMAWGGLTAETPGIVLRQMEDSYILKMVFTTSGDYANNKIATAVDIIRSARIVGAISSEESVILGSADLPPSSNPNQISLATAEYLTRINHTKIEDDLGEWLEGIDLSPNGQWLAVAHAREVLILDAQTLEVVRKRNLVYTEAKDVAFSPDGATVAISTGTLSSHQTDKDILQWDWETAEIREFEFDDARFPIGYVMYNPSGTWLGTDKGGWAPAILDAQTGNQLYEFPDAELMAFSPDDKWVAVTYTRLSVHEIHLYDADGELVKQLPMPDNQSANEIKFSSDGRFVAVGFTGVKDGKHEIRVWEVASGELYSVTYFDQSVPTQGLFDFVKSFAFSQDSTLLLAGLDQGSILLWDTATGQPIKRINVHGWRIRDVIISPDGERLYVADMDGVITVWHIAAHE